MPLPQMNKAFIGWEQIFTAISVGSETIDPVFGNVIKNTTNLQMKGVIQPFTDKKIEMKPEGQRSWNWFTIHVRNGYKVLNVNDFILHNNIKYKIMEVLPAQDYNFTRYHAIQYFDNN